MPAVAVVMAAASTTTFAVPSSRAQTAPGGATIARMHGRAFAQKTTGLTAAGRIRNACGLKAEGARGTAVSEPASSCAAPPSVGVHAYGGAAL